MKRLSFAAGVHKLDVTAIANNYKTFKFRSPPLNPILVPIEADSPQAPKPGEKLAD